jgi:uracil-DNA glycosylase family 4
MSRELQQLRDEIVDCRRCERLVAWREEVAQVKRRAHIDSEYWGRPVPGFGDPVARILVVGLAPGAHGSNRTGRQFTGDASGRFLFPALHRAGFCDRPNAEHAADGLVLSNVFITSIVRCVPPGNKPTPGELSSCQPYLRRELAVLRPKVIVCLGRIAFDGVASVVADTGPIGARPAGDHRKALVFAHGSAFRLLDGTWLLCSYHPSQQNTLTGRLTEVMFDAIWERASALLEAD